MTMTDTSRFVRRRSTPPWGCPPWCDVDHNDPDQEIAYDDPEIWSHRGPVGAGNFDIWLSDDSDGQKREAILTVTKFDDHKPGNPMIEVHFDVVGTTDSSTTMLTPGEARSIAAASISGADRADGLT